jgi:hypothetical protein
MSHDDPRMIGPLTDMLFSKRWRSLARNRLIVLLPRLPEVDTETPRVPVGLFNLYLEPTSAKLTRNAPTAELPVASKGNWGIVRNSRDMEMITAIAQGTPYFGDVTTLGHLRWLALYAVEPLRTAAEECLPRVEERVRLEQERRARQKVGEQLLRASAPAQTAQETLLRPATETQSTVSDQLLRPVQ